MKINYHGRRFVGVSNSSEGQVSEATVFHYQQHETQLTGRYSGGSIRIGHLIGIVNEDNTLYFLYHHIDIKGELRNGYCKSHPEILEDGRIRLHEKWEWTYGGEGQGESIVEEKV